MSEHSSVNLLDSRQLARAVWEYWTAIMEEDRIILPDEFPRWDEMEDDMKETLVETLKLKVSENVRKLHDSIVTKHETQKKFYCYSCDAGTASKPGGMCPTCEKRYL